MLASNYNRAQPALYDKTIGTSPQQDASVLAFEDTNQNQALDEGEKRFISRWGRWWETLELLLQTKAARLTNTALVAPAYSQVFLLGSMLNRQRASGASAKVASKKPVTASQAARARAGSGSHSRGK